MQRDQSFEIISLVDITQILNISIYIYIYLVVMTCLFLPPKHNVFDVFFFPSTIGMFRDVQNFIAPARSIFMYNFEANV